MKRQQYHDEEEELLDGINGQDGGGGGSGKIDDYAADNNDNDNDNDNDGDGDDGENMFSRALLNLSFNDRNQIEEEIHGVSCMAIEETRELIEESLYQFDIELDLIEENNKVAYNKAKNDLNSNRFATSFILCKENKLRFLRTELFDVQKSAIRYVKYLDLLYESYGECALQRPIRVQDFNREELSFFKSGQYQLLPHRDRSGRRIMAIVPNNQKYVPKTVLMKVFLYLWFVCVGGCDTSNNDINNAETQRRGIVVVVFPSGQHVYDTVNDEQELEKKDDKKAANEHNTTKRTKERLSVNSIIAKVVPLRVAAIHICLPNSQIFGVVASFYGIALKLWNARTRIHLGNPIEIRYKLQQHGIPIELIPNTDTGNIKSVNLNQWIKLRKHLEREEQIQMINNNKSATLCSSDCDNGYDYEVASTSSSSQSSQSHLLYVANANNIVECPLSTDVVFRRGKTMKFHVGNVNFQNLIESRMYEHTIDVNASPLRRTEIEIELMNEVRKKLEKTNGCDSGRFLTWNREESWWSVMQSDDEIQKKIHYAFRDCRKKILKTQQQQQKVQTITNLNSLFVRQDGQKKKRYNNSNNNTKDRSSISACGGNYNGNSSESDNNNQCIIPTPFNNSNNACGYFFSTDDGAYTNLDD